MMKSNGLFKRMLLMAALSLVGVGIVVLGVAIHYRGVSEDAEAVVIAWEKSERELYSFEERGLSEEEIEQRCNAACALYTDELTEKNYQKYYDAVSEISADARTVSCYNRIITDIRVDNRFRETRVYLDCVIDYEGYGPYLINGADEHLVKREKCTYSIKLKKEGDTFLISDIKRKWDTEKKADA